MTSLIILLKPATSNVDLTKFSNEHGTHLKRTKFGSSFEYKLSSFYAYLTALSFCDLFSCIFAILNMLEYIPPPYLDINITKYREFCLSISLYTHPIATTLQALSVWLICAFSIHRCRSIVKPSNFLSSIKKRKFNCNKNTIETENCKRNKLNSFFSKLFKSNSNKEERNYFCHMNLKNNCNHQSYELKFYTRKLLTHLPVCFCTVSSEYKPHDQSCMSSYEIQDPETKPMIQSQKSSKSKLRRVRLTIFLLYLVAFVYLIPQMFEKS